MSGELEELYEGDAVYAPVDDRTFHAKKQGFEHMALDLNVLEIKPGKMLDVGCGVGAALSVFRDMGWDVTGVELNRATAEEARRRVGARVFRLLEDTPPGEQFDLVFLSHILEHILDPLSFLEGITKRLSPNGTVIVRVPNYGSYSVRFVRRWRSLCFLPGQHIWYFDRHSLSELMSRGRFTVRRAYTRGHLTFRSSTFLRMLVKWPLVLAMRMLPNNGEEIVAAFRRA